MYYNNKTTTKKCSPFTNGGFISIHGSVGEIFYAYLRMIAFKQIFVYRICEFSWRLGDHNLKPLFLPFSIQFYLLLA